ncbi:MAG: glutamate--tRNA ligase [Pseudomonadota bacterium]
MSAPSSSSPVVRFAPSPTGRIHIGNVRTAVLNWLFARREGGTLILRFDDTDTERARAEFAEAITTDLTWLGLTWDRIARQSERTELYDRAAETLKRDGRLYPCYETPEEIERRRRLQRARGLPPIYDRASLKLTDAEREAMEREGRVPHWRFRLNNSGDDPAGQPESTPIAWDDLIRGHQTVDLGALSDPVMIRADGSYLYTFTSVVDDADMGVTHIIRGEDHVTNTGVQLQLFEALGADAPQFAHHSLLVGAEGQALSKRLGDLAIAALRDEGLEPQAVTSHAALVGTSDAIEPVMNPDDLAARFAFEKISRSPARFDQRELAQLNARLLQALDFESVQERLTDLGIAGGAPFWRAVRGNIGVLRDAQAWWTVVSQPLTPDIEDAAFCTRAAELLPDGPVTDETWGEWTRIIKAETGAKGKALFMPLRKALTAQTRGPELQPLLPFMGRERIVGRLSGETV